MTRFKYTPRPGEEISVTEEIGRACVTVRAGTHFAATVSILASEVPFVARNIAETMHLAAGLPAPVILDRPADLSPVSTQSGVIAGIEDGRILVGLTPTAVGLGRSAELQPGEARTLAASLAHFADHVEALPDPAEVEELAMEIKADLHRIGGSPLEAYEIAARTALRWMKDREGRDG